MIIRDAPYLNIGIRPGMKPDILLLPGWTNPKTGLCITLTVEPTLLHGPFPACIKFPVTSQSTRD